MEFNLREFIAQVFFGNGGLTKKQHRGEVNHQFSNFLPYIAADFATKNTIAQGITDFTQTYYLNDNSFAWIYEYELLLTNSSNDVMSAVSEAIKLFSDNTIIQFIVHAGLDNRLIFGCRGFVSIKISLKNKVINSSYEDMIKEIKSYDDVRNNFENIMLTAGLQLKLVEPDNLLLTLNQLSNDVNKANNEQIYWNSLKPLNKQVINSETEITIHSNSLQIDSKHLACLTPKQFPQSFDVLFNNNFLKSLLENARNNQAQFVYNVAIIVNNIEQTASKFETLKSEFRLITNENFLDVIPTLWVIEENEEKLNERINDFRMILTTNEIENQLEYNSLLPKLFVLSLPAGMSFYDIGLFERSFMFETEIVPYILPIAVG